MASKKGKTGGLSPKDLSMVLVLLGLVLIACSYFFIFRSNSSKRTELKASNDELQATLDSLVQMENNKAQTEEDTELKKQAINDILVQFPSGMTEEKVIDIIDDMEKETKVVVSNIGFSMDEQYFPDAAAVAAAAAAEQAAAEAAAAEEGAEGEGGEAAPAEEAAPVEVPLEEGEVNVANLTGYKAKISLSYTSDYEQLQKMIDYINNHEDKMRIESISAAYDTTTGGLSGSLIINMYSIDGNITNEYVAPEIKNERVGVKHGIFNTTRIEENAEEGEENEDNAGNERNNNRD